jgi:hypothetical protein
MLLRWLISCLRSITAFVCICLVTVLACLVRSGINHIFKNYLFLPELAYQPYQSGLWRSEDNGFRSEIGPLHSPAKVLAYQ